ncbi:MAG: transcription antitermination factor NusB [Oscillospiraceae bacterium]|jgi:N utilization substance protein B|nr:transcription antitermination factor NusB [Oscillospiraceae bacterium]
MTQREKRESAFLLLFQAQLNDDKIEEIIENNISEFELVTDKSVVKTINGVLENTAAADEIIARYSKTRKVGRIAKVSLTILRLALYEMDCLSDMPDKVAINEAVELCKKYADKQDCSFVSGLLGAYYKESRTDRFRSCENDE